MTFTNLRHTIPVLLALSLAAFAWGQNPAPNPNPNPAPNPGSASTSNPPPPPAPGKMSIIVEADGKRSRWNLSEYDIYILNLLIVNTGESADIRFLKWLIGVRNTLADRPEFAPPAVKADQDAIEQRMALKKQRIENSIGKVNKEQ
jgi:hypothetical protein